MYKWQNFLPAEPFYTDSQEFPTLLVWTTMVSNNGHDTLVVVVVVRVAAVLVVSLSDRSLSLRSSSLPLRF